MAIKKGNIIQNINELEILFNNSLSSKREFFYAKLTVLEACGWIEETMDNIIHDYHIRKLPNPSNQREIQDVITRTFGFDYTTNFRKMVIHTVGLINVSKIETTLEMNGDLTTLKAKLGNLKVYRNNFAHTHTKKGSIPSYPHPSLIKNEINIIFTCLKLYQQELRKIR
jgi:hypothetical protein